MVGFPGLMFYVLFGEFDPGSGRTLAACLTHASRTVKRLPLWWVWERLRLWVFLVGDGLAAYQLVGGVMAYQGFDG